MSKPSPTLKGFFKKPITEIQTLGSKVYKLLFSRPPEDHKAACKSMAILCSGTGLLIMTSGTPASLVVGGILIGRGLGFFEDRNNNKNTSPDFKP